MFIFILITCSPKGKFNEKEVNPVDSKGAVGKEHEGLTLPSEPVIEQDSAEIKRFWQEAIVPILMRNKEIVLKNMDFPLIGHCAQMMEIEVCDSTSFRKVYDKFFSDYFILLLSKKSHKDVGMFLRESKVSFGFSIQDSTGMAAVFLIFNRNGKAFKLKEVQGAGGNFYLIND
jgi:hypothetical protein